LCEVESVHDTGDHTLFIGRVLKSVANERFAGEAPLLYSDVYGAAPPAVKGLKRVLAGLGALDRMKSFLQSRRPPPPPNIRQATYEVGGQTDREIEALVQYGVVDSGRALEPGSAPAFIEKKIGICVVGTGWGSLHCQTIRK